MPREFIAPSDAHLVKKALADARRSGRDFVDLLHDRDLLLTPARRQELVREEFGLLERVLNERKPEEILYWYFRDTLPHTTAEMFDAVRAWIVAYGEQR